MKKEFHDELNVMARLNHPNCIGLLGANIQPPKVEINAAEYLKLTQMYAYHS